MVETIKTKKRNLKWLFIFNGLLLVIAFGMIHYSVDKTPIQQINEVEPVIQGIFKDRFTLYDDPLLMPEIPFHNAFDRQMTLDDFKGKWVFLNLWASWCPPCIVEMPSLQQFQDLYESQGVQVVGLSLDKGFDGKKLRVVMERFQFGPVAAYYGDYPLLNEKIEIKSLPTTYVIAPDGRVIGVYVGDADWASDDAKMFVEN